MGSIATHKELDISMMLAAKCHLGTKNCDFQMERYISRRQNTGIYVINLGKTWEKLIMAARVIVAIENPQDVCVLSARTYGQRAVLKFCQYTGCKALAGRHTPGTFTNQIQKRFEEPRLLILTDPRCGLPEIYACCTALVFLFCLEAMRRCEHTPTACSSQITGFHNLEFAQSYVLGRL